MKKNILIALFCIALVVPAQAELLKAKAIDGISTKAPKEVINVRVLRNFALDKETVLKEGYVLTGKMTDIVEPDKWQQDASFTFVPISYTDTQGNKHEITSGIKATYKQKIDPAISELGVGLPSGGYFAPQYVINLNRKAKKEDAEENVSRTAPWGKGLQLDIKPEELIYFSFPD